MPELSVLLPVRDGAQTLALSILSVLKQSYSDFELLILDDGSIDASPDIALRFDDSRVRVTCDGEKRGLAARLNQGIDSALGRYIARMDSDDVCFPERFARQIARLKAESSLDLVACRVLDFDWGGCVTGLRPYYLTHEALCARPWNGFYLPHPSWMGRADWFRRFRYRIPEAHRVEDQELLLRAYAESRYAVLDEILLGYRVRPSSLSKLGLQRRSLFAVQVGHFTRCRQWKNLLFAMAGTALKLPRDLIFAAAGGRYELSRWRTTFPFETEQSWNTLIDSLYRQLDEIGLAHGGRDVQLIS